MSPDRRATPWWNAPFRFAGSLLRYYRLDPPAPPVPWPGHDRGMLLALAILMQALYLATIPFMFECDAGAYYDFAKALVGQGGKFSFIRAPFYPVFLVLTGTVWPGTFAIVLLVQVAMGVAIPLMIYRTLDRLGRWPAWLGALMVMISGTPFAGAMFMLSEQLYLFLTLLTVYFLASYQDRGDPRAFYGFLLAGLGATFTRWEAGFVFIFGFCAILLFAFRRPRQFRHCIIGIVLTLIALGGYSTARAFFMGDMRLIGTVQNGSGLQLFHRLYGTNPYSVTTRVSTILGSAAVPISGPQLLSPANGPASRQLRDLIASEARENPGSYRALKEPLTHIWVEKDAPPEGPYEELFGRFEGAPDALADNIFRYGSNFRTTQYVTYVRAVAEQRLGLAAGDRLLLAMGIEAIRANPGILLAISADGLTLTGASLEGIAALIRDSLDLTRWPAVFPIWSLFDYKWADFDMGACATNSLSPHMLAEYRFAFELISPSFNHRAIVPAAFGRNLVRAVSGGILLLGWWLLLMAGRRGLTLPVLAGMGCLMLAIGISVGGANTKYDLTFIPLLVIVAVSIATEAVRRMSRLVPGHATERSRR